MPLKPEDTFAEHLAVGKLKSQKLCVTRTVTVPERVRYWHENVRTPLRKTQLYL